MTKRLIYEVFLFYLCFYLQQKGNMPFDQKYQILSSVPNFNQALKFEKKVIK